MTDTAYSADGLRTSITRSDATAVIGSTNFGYNDDGRLNLIEHLDSAGGNLTTFGFTEYDANSRIKQRVTTRDVIGLIGNVPAYLSETFDYDQDGQLLRVNLTGGADAVTVETTDSDNYRYDEAGNRVLADDIAFTPGLENRLLSDTEFVYTYDDQGRLTKKSEKLLDGSADPNNFTAYTWDHRGLLLKAQRFGADLVTVEYGYDVSGRRTARKEGADQTITHYDGQNRLAEFNSSGDIVRHYLNGLGPNEVLAVDQGGETAWAFADQLGSITTWGTHDGANWSLQHQSFDAFGNLDGSTTSILVNSLPQIWAGHHFEITLDLYHMQARWYDPRTGKFISLDPTRFEAGDANQYRYTGNDPVNAVDPTGTEEFPVSDAIDLDAITRSLLLDSFNNPIDLSRVLNQPTLSPAGPTEYFRRYANDPIFRNQIDEFDSLSRAQQDIQFGTPFEAFRGQLAISLNGTAGDFVPGGGEFQDALVLFGDDSSRGQRLLSAGSLLLSIVTLGGSPNAGSSIRAANRTLGPILETQRDLATLANRQADVVSRFLGASDSRVAKAFRDATTSNPNFANLIEGRVLDRRLNKLLKRQSLGDGVRLDRTIPDSGSRLRPDIFFPSLDGKSVIFDFGGPSKINNLKKFQGLADEIIPIVPVQRFP